MDHAAHDGHHEPAPGADTAAEHQDHAAGHDRHAGHSVAMFRDKFWLSLALTIPVMLLSPDIEEWFGYTIPAVPGIEYVPAILGTIIFLYGGVVFIRGAQGELADRKPGMMTLISLAITVALLGTFYLFPVVYGALGRVLLPELYLSGATDTVVVALPSRVDPGSAGSLFTALLAAGAFAAFLARTVDQRGIDGAVNGVAELVGSSARSGRRLQSGLVRSYALGVLGGAVLIVAFLVFRP